jgi:hypothetical protein
MKRVRLMAMVFAALCPVVAGRSEASDVPGIESRYNALFELAQTVADRPQIEQEPTIRAEFQRSLAHAYNDADLRRVSDADLRRLMLAGEVLGFFAYAQSDLPYVERPLQVLERRGVANDDDRARYFRVLVGLRRFEQARAYRAAHPAMDVEQMPAVVDASGNGTGPVAYAISAERLTKVRAPIDVGVHLIVVAHPLCAYSRKAMEALGSDARLSPFLRGRATWLAPVNRRIGMDVLATWNDVHTATPLVLTDRREDWPFIRIWSTPTFYVLRDGKLVGAFEGWPGDGRRPQLVALLRAAGVDVE